MFFMKNSKSFWLKAGAALVAACFAFSVQAADKKILGYGTVHDVADWTMRFGNTGKKVTELQEKLVYLGWLSEHNITGHFGINTQDAITRFQTAYNLKVLGIANIETQTLLNRLVEEKRYADPDAWIVVEEDDDFFE